jgi:hypothetical protein
VYKPLTMLVGLFLGLPGCRYHLGSPPSTVGLRVSEIQAPIAEPGVADAMAEALGAAIRRAGAEGERAILVRVERASFEPCISRAGQVLVWEAELAATFVLVGPRPREIDLQRSTRLGLAGVGAQVDQPRAAAFAELARVLADEAVSSFLYAPSDADEAPGAQP